jgi:hypothetical protein
MQLKQNKKLKRLLKVRHHYNFHQILNKKFILEAKTKKKKKKKNKRSNETHATSTLQITDKNNKEEVETTSNNDSIGKQKAFLFILLNV